MRNRKDLGSLESNYFQCTSESKEGNEEVGLIKTGHGYSYWVEILNSKAKAPENGLFLFACLDDNHFEYVLSNCSCDDILKNSMIVANRNHEPDVLLAYHPVGKYSPQSVAWTEYKTGDKANIAGMYIWFIRKNGEEKYVYRNYQRGENMLPADFNFCYNGIVEEYRDWEYLAYHGCFYYTTSQLKLHNELYAKFIP